MALGLFIGAAVAAKVAQSAANLVKTVQSAQSGEGLDFDDIKNAAVNRINKVFGQNNNDSISSRANMVNNTADQQMTTEYEFEQAREAFCEYCDGLIPLTKGYFSCPHCGAAIQRSAVRVVVKKQRTRPVYVKPQEPEFIPGAYYVRCYNCGTNVRYSTSDIYHNPGANRAVKEKGFRGHTGEVKCPRCGNYLPHFETNLYK